MVPFRVLSLNRNPSSSLTVIGNRGLVIGAIGADNSQNRTHWFQAIERAIVIVKVQPTELPVDKRLPIFSLRFQIWWIQDCQKSMGLLAFQMNIIVTCGVKVFQICDVRSTRHKSNRYV
jgi:hypothetical protein